MTEFNIMDALGKDLEAAKAAQLQNQQRENSRMFKHTYRSKINRKDGTFWGHGGSIQYNENGVPEIKNIQWLDASDVADAKLEGKITDVTADPRNKGIIAARIARALDWSLDKRNTQQEGKRMMAEQAIAGMYLMGLQSRTLLRKIELGLAQPHNAQVGEVYSRLFRHYDMVPEEFKDLPISNTPVLQYVLANTLRPLPSMTDDEAFAHGYDEARNNAYDPNGMHAAKVTFTKDGVAESRRVGAHPSRFTDFMLESEISDVCMTARDKGKLAGYVQNILDRLARPDLDRGSSIHLMNEYVAGQYVLGELNTEQTVGALRTVLEKRPELGDTVVSTLQRYKPRD